MACSAKLVRWVVLVPPTRRNGASLCRSASAGLLGETFGAIERSWSSIIANLSRLQREDVHADYIVLRDPKGRRAEARRHAVPLLDDAKTALKAFPGAPSVFTVDRKAISPAALYRLEAEAIGERIEAFEAKRLRSGMETALASLGIGREIRAQVQSHGLGGVQDRHYDDHDYMPEKRAALQALVDLLEAEPASNVTPIHGAAA